MKTFHLIDFIFFLLLIAFGLANVVRGTNATISSYNATNSTTWALSCFFHEGNMFHTPSSVNPPVANIKSSI